MPSPTDLLTTGKAAKIAGVSLGTVWQWCVNGHLPFIRPGGGYLITRHDLDAFLAKPRKRPGQYDRSTIKKRGTQ